MRTKKSVIVIGTITRDTLIHPGASSIETLGGILYEIIGLASLSEDLIIPIANVGSDIFEQVLNILSVYPNVSLEGLARVKQPNYHVSICYFTESGCQFDRHFLPPLTLKQIKHFQGASMILSAMISGFDVTLDTLRVIRRDVKCPIYLDYHCLASGYRLTE